MKIQNLKQLRDLIKDGWKVDCKQGRESIWKSTWISSCDQGRHNNQALELGKYRLKSPKGEIIPVEYCEGDLDEHTFKVGDRVRCKPGYKNNVKHGELIYGGAGYIECDIVEVEDVDHDMVTPKGNFGVGIYTRALELVAPKVTEPYIGMRVKRGPDWDYNDQGCGYGKVLYLPDLNDDWYTIEWDDGSDYEYKFNHGGVVEDTDYVKPKEEPVWNGKVLECTEEDIQESVGFWNVYINTDVSYDLVKKVRGTCVHVVSGVKYSRMTSHSGLWDLFLLQDNEYVRIVDKKKPKVIEDLNVHIDTTANLSMGFDLLDKACELGIPQGNLLGTLVNQKIEVGDTVECIEYEGCVGSIHEVGYRFKVADTNPVLSRRKDGYGVHNVALKLIKKGDVATPVSSDKQINTKQNGCKSNEVRNIDQQDRVRDQQGRESIQSRRGRTTVESRPIVYKEITSHFKKSGSVG